ncbi:MAG: sigma-70 family RNA polymerase sigma factor [Armatimonadota bacterium]
MSLYQERAERWGSRRTVRMQSAGNDPQAAWELVAANPHLSAVAVSAYLRRFRVPGGLGLEREDLLSEARLAVHAAARKWDPRRGSFASYAVASVRYRLHRLGGLCNSPEARERKSLLRAAPLSEVHEEASPEWFIDSTVPGPDDVEGEAFREALYGAIDALPARPRSVVERFLSGKSFLEIAEEEGCSRQRVDQLYRGAVKRLRESLEPWLDPDALSARLEAQLRG